MTDVHVYLTYPDPATGEDRPALGSVSATPSRRRHKDSPPLDPDDRIVLPIERSVKLVDGRAVLKLDSTGPEWCWMVIENVARGIRRYVAVPDVPAVDYGDLIDVDRATLDPVAEPEAAWWAFVNGLDTDLSEVIVSAEVIGDNIFFTHKSGTVFDGGRVRGQKGDKGDVGPIGMQWRGEWDAVVDYVEDDAVAYFGSSWFAVLDPEVGDVPGVSPSWQAFAVQGSQGDPGRGVVSILRTSGDGSPGTLDTYTVTYDDSTTDTFEVTNGADGAPNTLAIGTVTTGPAGATITGTSPAQTLSLTLPQGEPGVQGSPGDIGPAVLLGNVSGAINLSTHALDAQWFGLTATGNLTLSAANMPSLTAGKSGTISLSIKQDGTGSRTLVTTGIAWAEGVAPILPTEPNAKAVWHFSRDGFGDWIGWVGARKVSIP